VRALSKTFQGGAALQSLNLEVATGQVHALLGENGSGKSTLIKLVSGYHYPDEGSQIEIGGENLPFGDPLASLRLGARFVHQDLGLVEGISIADNVIFGSRYPTRFGRILWSQTKASVEAALEIVGLDLDPTALVSSLSAAQKTGVAVARALRTNESDKVYLLVLDEPTARLPEREVENLHSIVKSVSDKGIGVLYVTHRLDEVPKIADWVTVLRDGVGVVSRACSELGLDELINLVSGHEHVSTQRTFSVSNSGNKCVTVDALTSEYLDRVSFEIGKGEILGVAGITGSGRDVLCATIFGGRPRDGGHISVNGVNLEPKNPIKSVAAGIAYIPAERKVLSSFMTLSATHNMSITQLRHLNPLRRLRKNMEQDIAKKWFKRFSVRPDGAIGTAISSFSGGNQQKIILGRWFEQSPSLLLLDEPTQGVDVGAKSEIHAELRQIAHSDGASILVTSTDIDELVALCDQILILKAGRIVGKLSGSEISTSEVSRMIVGNLN